MGTPKRELEDIAIGGTEGQVSGVPLSSRTRSYAVGGTHDAIVARGGVWKSPFVLTAGSSTPPGNEMTFDGLRHQLNLTCIVKAVFIRYLPLPFRAC